MTYCVKINHHDYTQYIKQKTGLTYERDNTNDEDAGRDEGEVMHPNVTSHQRKLSFKMGPMSFEVAQQLERDLQGNDDGVLVEYPDLHDGQCSRMFYNTSTTAAMEQFTKSGLLIDNVSFTVISVKEEMV